MTVADDSTSQMEYGNYYLIFVNNFCYVSTNVYEYWVMLIGITNNVLDIGVFEMIYKPFNPSASVFYQYIPYQHFLIHIPSAEASSKNLKFGCDMSLLLC